MAPTRMRITSFQPVRFGNWTTKLSYTCDDESLFHDDASFLVVAINEISGEVILRAFNTEPEVIKFVSFLGDKNELY